MLVVRNYRNPHHRRKITAGGASRQTTLKNGDDKLDIEIGQPARYDLATIKRSMSEDDCA